MVRIGEGKKLKFVNSNLLFHDLSERDGIERERERGRERDRDSAVGVNVEWEGMVRVCREGREKLKNQRLYLETVTVT